MASTLFPTVTRNFRKVAGDTFCIAVKITGLSSTVSEAYMSCKKNKSDDTYVFQKTWGNGITVDSDGIYRFKASPSDTNVAEGRYYYDCQIRYGSDVETVVMGTVDFVWSPTDED